MAESTATLTLTNFLLARITEDEAAWSGGTDLVTRPDFARLSRHMLAECDAKRRIVAACDSEEGWAQDGSPSGAIVGEFALEFLAAVYADHPDYRDEWRT